MSAPVVVTPTFQESATIGALVRALVEQGAAVLVVDDDSPDGTAQLAEQHGATVIRRVGRRGFASAYVEGLQAALALGGGPIVQMDADLSHDPADLPRLLAALSGGAQLALGSRYVPGGGTRNWELYRRVLSRFGSLYARAWLGLPYHDLTGGFKAWDPALLARIDLGSLRGEGYVFQVECTLRAARLGATITEVPILFTERAGGVSKMSTAVALEAGWVVPRLRWTR